MLSLVEDAPKIYDIIKGSKPLDLNSEYCYLILCLHFFETCVVAEWNSRIIGFISAYIQPAKKDTLFVWQVAVHQSARQKGVALKMLKHLLKRDVMMRISFVETTVTPSNQASRMMFYSLAKDLETMCVESDQFSEEMFDGDGHEREVLFRIGPF